MEKRFAITHWLSMGIGGRIPPLLGVEWAAAYKEGRYLIALAHEGTMASALLYLIGFSWASADGFRRSLPLV